MAQLTTLDLFSGAGGMALGFEAAGFKTIGAVDFDEASAVTFKRMFSRDSPVVFGGADRGDMTSLSTADLLAALPDKPDVVIGGPPCQGFSRIGLAKQTSLLSAKEKARRGGLQDPDRNLLYRRFLDVVSSARPLAFVMENVPAMRSSLGVDMAGRISREASHLGYNVRCFLLNAAWYGVPQQRWRIFFVGLRGDLGARMIPRPPARTHDHGTEIPEGTPIPDDSWMIWGEQIPKSANLLPAVTVRQAIGDLPRLVGHLRGVKPEGSELPLQRSPSDWARRLRAWKGREAEGPVTGNWYRFTRRDFRIFREMAHGDCYPEALAIANRLFRENLAELRRAGCAPEPDTPAFEELRRTFIPPYRNDAFHDKWRKLIPSEPSWTLTAHLSRDTYSHIHYSSAQARTITVREAARLQSFPDSFEFSGSFGDQFKQIGNAVPPLLARALALNLSDQLQGLMEEGSESFAGRSDAVPLH